MRELAERIAGAGLGWLPASVLGSEDELDQAETAGWLERYERAEGRYETLTPWAAEVLGIHLNEVRTGKEHERALAFARPEPGEAVCRWAPLAEEGPAPVQPREDPCVRRLTAWDLIAEPRVPSDEPGGRGTVPETPARRAVLRRLLREADRERRERERRRGRARQRRRA